jgi:precorrin-2 dehydrogenase/sirohydrochlorin ferrochelatase
MHLPVMLKVEGALCLVIGGGRVAERKVAALLEAKASVRIISPSVSEALDRLHREGRVDIWRRPFRPGDLDEPGLLLVVAATDDANVNRLVCAEARGRRLLVNEPSGSGGGNVDLPAVVRRGRLVLSVYTSQASPGLARRIKRRLEEEFPAGYAGYVDFLADMRALLKEKVTDEERRRRLLEQLLDLDWRVHAQNGTLDALRGRLIREWRLDGD